MAASEERREVAERLREHDGNAYADVADMCDEDLADLIDPTCSGRARTTRTTSRGQGRRSEKGGGRMSGCKTIITFNSGRTVTLKGDWVAELMERPMTKWQFFPSQCDWVPVSTVINMDLVETVVVTDDGEEG